MKVLEISGKVIKGQKYGRKLGYPTANLDRREYSGKKLKIRLGIYAGRAEILNPKSQIQNPKFYTAAIVIGPLEKNNLPKIEANLIGFKGNLYNKYLRLHLQGYLRPFKKFKNAEQLKLQIKKDIQQIIKKNT